LQAAAHNSSLKTAKVLIEAKANIEKVTPDKYGTTPLLSSFDYNNHHFLVSVYNDPQFLI